VKKKILVTGAAGFIGSNLCKRLISEGYQVIGIDNLSAGHRDNIPKKIEFHPADIRDKSITPIFKGVDTVFHLAAKNCLIDCLNDPIATSDINVKGTVNVLEAAKQNRIRKFVFADSSAVYEGVYDFPSKIDTVKPVGAYAVSKHCASLFTRMYHDFFGLNITILRYFCVYGPAQDYRRTMPPVISAFILKLLNKERPLIYGTGEKRRDFIHIDDVNDFHILTIEDSRTDNRTFNLGSGISYSVNDIFNIVTKALRINTAPTHLDEMPGEADMTLADITKEKELGWQPRIGINEGILDSINYLRDELLIKG